MMHQESEREKKKWKMCEEPVQEPHVPNVIYYLFLELLVVQ